MSLIRRSPFNAPAWPLREELNRLFDDFLVAPQALAPAGWSGFTPAVDVAETPESLIVHAEIPGLDPKEVQVSLTGNTLVLRGEKKAETEHEDRNALRVERVHGAFIRTLTLPEGIDPERVQAHAKNGVLTIEIPKAERAKPQQIEVKVID